MQKTQLNEEGRKVLTRLKKSKLDGCTVKVIGNWIWVSGETKQYKEKLNNYGLKFATKKKVWYFTTDKYGKRFNTPKTTKYAEEKYGCETIIEA